MHWKYSLSVLRSFYLRYITNMHKCHNFLEKECDWNFKLDIISNYITCDINEDIYDCQRQHRAGSFVIFLLEKLPFNKLKFIDNQSLSPKLIFLQILPKPPNYPISNTPHSFFLKNKSINFANLLFSTQNTIKFGINYLNQIIKVKFFVNASKKSFTC